MTNQFTSPEFADLLKRYGIEVETPFYWDLHSSQLRLFASDSEGNKTLIGVTAHSAKVHKGNYIEPAYLLSQVLGWLPERFMWKEECFVIEQHSFKRNEFSTTQSDLRNSPWKGRHNPVHNALTIEDLICQGLTEGWLTKDIILQNIKDNQ